MKNVIAYPIVTLLVAGVCQTGIGAELPKGGEDLKQLVRDLSNAGPGVTRVVREKGAVTIHGLNYKDQPADAEKWLTELGDPYTRTGADINGRVAIDWGVYGVPETFVIDRQGRIAYKQIGPINPEILEKTILPLIRQLRQ